MAEERKMFEARGLPIVMMQPGVVPPGLALFDVQEEPMASLFEEPEG